MARQHAKQSKSQDAILVGGKHYVAVTESDLDQIFELLQLSPHPDITTLGAVSVRSVYIPSHGYGGMLYRNGEYCVVTCPDDEQDILQITKIFSVKFEGCYNIFLQGEQYKQAINTCTTHHTKDNALSCS